MEPLRGNASSLHTEALKIIKGVFPHYGIINDQPIKVGGNTLYLDIYIKELKIAIETDGEQHEKFSKFFHGNAAGFAKSKNNDTLKEQYCLNNGIVLVRFKKNEINKNTILTRINQTIKERNNEQ